MIQPVHPFQTKEEYVYQTLRHAILRCELAPGEKLVIDRLSIEIASGRCVVELIRVAARCVVIRCPLTAMPRNPR